MEAVQGEAPGKVWCALDQLLRTIDKEQCAWTVEEVQHFDDSTHGASVADLADPAKGSAKAFVEHLRSKLEGKRGDWEAYKTAFCWELQRLAAVTELLKQKRAKRTTELFEAEEKHKQAMDCTRDKVEAMRKIVSEQEALVARCEEKLRAVMRTAKQEEEPSAAAEPPKQAAPPAMVAPQQQLPRQQQQQPPQQQWQQPLKPQPQLQANEDDPWSDMVGQPDTSAPAAAEERVADDWGSWKADEPATARPPQAAPARDQAAAQRTAPPRPQPVSAAAHFSELADDRWTPPPQQPRPQQPPAQVPVQETTWRAPQPPAVSTPAPASPWGQAAPAAAMLQPPPVVGPRPPSQAGFPGFTSAPPQARPLSSAHVPPPRVPPPSVPSGPPGPPGTRPPVPPIPQHAVPAAMASVAYQGAPLPPPAVSHHLRPAPPPPAMPPTMASGGMRHPEDENDEEEENPWQNLE